MDRYHVSGLEKTVGCQMSKKILYFFDASDWHSRMEAAHKAKEKGFDVSIGLINGDKNEDDYKITPIKKSENSVGVLASLGMVKSMRDLIKKERPDIVHIVTLKYSFMGGLAALGNDKTRKIYTMAGLGYLFRGDDNKSKLLRHALTPFLKFAFKRPDTTLIFQNADDMDLFVKGNFVNKENANLIKGSGVYLDQFNNHANEDAPPVILMPTRLVHEKGIHIFVEAARLLKAKGIKAKFQIAGGETNHNPRGISRAEMEDMIHDGAVEWLGRVDDLPARLASAAFVVYPSYYGEGIPRVLLESCAAGKPIITTDHPGCKEAVDHGVNGLLVPVKDAKSTANAIEQLLQDPQKRSEMGNQSRIKAEREFDIHLIANQTVHLYE